MDEHFFAVARATGAEWGELDFYRGILDRAPFLLRQTGSEPPGCYFKFRKKGLMGRPAPVKRPPPVTRGQLPADTAPREVWHDSLVEKFTKAGVSCEMEDEYVLLWINKPHLLTPEEITTLARECVREHAYLLPDQDRLCLSCGSTGEAELLQAGASVATICPHCLDKKLETHAATVETINRSDPKFSLLLPLALLGGCIAWAAFWITYDMLFGMLGTDRILIPFWIVMVIAAGVGFAAGWPIGKVLHRSGVAKRFPGGPLALFAALVIVAGGELLYAVGTVFRLTGSFNLGLALRATLIFALGSNALYAATKLIFAAALAGAILEVSKLKTKNLRI